MNDSPVRLSEREWTEPQRDRLSLHFLAFDVKNRVRRTWRMFGRFEKVRYLWFGINRIFEKTVKITKNGGKNVGKKRKYGGELVISAKKTLFLLTKNFFMV